MEFRTPIQCQKSQFPLVQNQKVLMMGSCFAEEVGHRMQQDGFPVDLNPFGVLYNPLSIARALDVLLSGRLFTQGDLFESGGLWNSWLHHSQFSAVTPEECLQRINSRLLTARETLQTASTLIITLGSHRYYMLKERPELVVGNCHKVPENQFSVADMSVTDIQQALGNVLVRVKERNPEVQVIFTVSPIRYLKYGLQKNMVGKATILLAVDALQMEFDWIHYFPAFEIMLDDLRDYRFYGPDMIHPSSVAVDYIYDRFKDVYFNQTSWTIAQEWQEIEKALNHRPINPESAAYKTFLEKVKQKINQFQQEYPGVYIQDKLELCISRLNKL